MFFLTKIQADQLIGHSRDESPNEVCGILAGRDSHVEKVYRMINTDESAKTFLMEPKEQLKVMKEIRSLKLEMIGIYHSHLETEAYPSEHDVRLAFYPDAYYVIVSLKNETSPSIRAFRIIDGRITEEEVKVV